MEIWEVSKTGDNVKVIRLEMMSSWAVLTSSLQQNRDLTEVKTTVINSAVSSFRSGHKDIPYNLCV